MKALTIPEIAQALWEVSSVLILTHRRPDGDTAGSAAALCRGLRSLGKKAFILENPQLTERYRPYHRGLTCPAPIPGALVVSVDVAGREMLCKGAQTLPVDLLLDHHGTNPGFAARGHIDPSAGACGEIIYRVLTAMGLRLDRPTAEALYVAVSTDTGCFRYSNTTAHTLQVAAACLEALPARLSEQSETDRSWLVPLSELEDNLLQRNPHQEASARRNAGKAFQATLSRLKQDMEDTLVSLKDTQAE